MCGVDDLETIAVVLSSRLAARLDTALKQPEYAHNDRSSFVVAALRYILSSIDGEALYYEIVDGDPGEDEELADLLSAPIIVPNC